jgi:uncharacterized protein YndB with AHSA1/START domain
VARADIRVSAPPRGVWATLRDPWTFPAWVVGTVKIRAVEGVWPEKGSKIHHAVGAWPIEIRDETEVLDCDPERRLVLQARAWPVGEATVRITLEPHRDGTRIYLEEEPTAGPGRWVNNRLVDAVGRHRLEEMLARLAPIVEGRHGTEPGPAVS